jgi:integrase
MAVLAECPLCHKKQSAKNKTCSCGEGLDKAKKAKRVRYWINYRLPGGKQRREPVGFSIKEAQDADGKRKVQKRERRIFDMLPEADMTFEELTDWYCNLPDVKDLATSKRVRACLNNFNKMCGDRIVGTLKGEDIQKYQEHRREQGRAPATIDMEVLYVKGMLTKAFYDDKVDGRLLKVFKSVKRKLRAGENAREQTLSIEQYLRLVDAAKVHLKPIVITALHTGMRKGEILGLQWSHVDKDNQMIRLPASGTKEKRPKRVPINRYVKEVLDSLPRHIHHDFVFTYEGEPIGSNFRRSLASACKTAGILLDAKDPTGYRFHDIRATTKTFMVDAGVDKALRDTIMGHSLRGMDKHYLRFKDEDLRAGMARYTEWLDKQFADASSLLTKPLTKGV